jgi:hypothetical protein
MTSLELGILHAYVVDMYIMHVFVCDDVHLCSNSICLLYTKIWCTVHWSMIMYTKHISLTSFISMTWWHVRHTYMCIMKALAKCLPMGSGGIIIPIYIQNVQSIKKFILFSQTLSLPQLFHWTYTCTYVVYVHIDVIKLVYGRCDRLWVCPGVYCPLHTV